MKGHDRWFQHLKLRARGRTMVVSPDPEGVLAGKYLPKVEALARGRKGQLSVATIAHDDWCDLLNERGACNCNPDVTIESVH